MCTSFQITLFLLIIRHFSQSWCQDPTSITALDPEQMKYPVFLKAGSRFCTGTVIEKEWVLTAAHCLKHGGVKVEITTGVEVGRSGSNRKSSDVILHPDFKLDQISMYDIALVKVSPPFDFTTEVSLPVKAMTPDDSKLCVIHGYGGHVKAVGGGAGNNTQAANLPTPSTSRYRLRTWTAYPQDGLDACPSCKRFQCQRMICSGLAEDEAGLCEADSGGGLVCYQCDASSETCGAARLYGVAHMAMDKAFLDSPPAEKEKTIECVMNAECSTRPTVNFFMKVCPLVLWIAKYVPDVPPECDSVARTHADVGGLLMLSFIIVFHL